MTLGPVRRREASRPVQKGGESSRSLSSMVVLRHVRSFACLAAGGATLARPMPPAPILAGPPPATAATGCAAGGRVARVGRVTEPPILGGTCARGCAIPATGDPAERPGGRAAAPPTLGRDGGGAGVDAGVRAGTGGRAWLGAVEGCTAAGRMPTWGGRPTPICGGREACGGRAAAGKAAGPWGASPEASACGGTVSCDGWT